MSDSELKIYEDQLKTIQAALASCDDELEKKNLLSLENDIKELINLSFLQSLEGETEEKSDEESTANQGSDGKELSKLINQKCRAPFSTGEAAAFHNAFIADIDHESDGEVFVRIFFLNPTVDKMKPCNFYFSDKCTYDDDCRFSHGEIIAFSKLKPYIDPNFSLLKNKTHILAKSDSAIWKPGTILEINHDQKTCKIKSFGKISEVCFSDVLPPVDNSDSESDSDLSTDDESDFSEAFHTNCMQIDDTFGEWEKHTRGIGSKIMQKLGYKLGEGLGKRNDGISQPVSAVIYIQGKSLDFNMEQREKNHHQTVEEKVKKDSKRHREASEKQYSKPENDVFSFINNISQIKPSTSSGKSDKSEDLKKQSKAQLNLKNFKTEEEIKKVEKSLDHLKTSQLRHKSDSPAYKNIKRKIDETQGELSNLRRQLTEVTREQKTRSDYSKLTIF